MKYSDRHPRHSRSSCSDENPRNADPSGHGCTRCTALVMDYAMRNGTPVRVIINGDDCGEYLYVGKNPHRPDSVVVTKSDGQFIDVHESEVVPV